METLVVMPTYNSKETVEEAIQSVMSQTYKKFNLVCCDDNSTDETLSTLVRIKKKYNFKILKNKKNLGTGLTVNSVINTELYFKNYNFITWVSSDNILNKDFLKKHTDNVRDGHAISYSGWSSFDSEGKYTVHVPQENLISLRESYLLGPSFLFTRKLYETAGPFHRLPGEDFLFAVSCALNDAKFGFIKDSLVDYRIHDNSVGGRIRSGKITDLATNIALEKSQFINKSNGNKFYI